MLKKLLKDTKLVDIVSWYLSHPDEKYDAQVVSINSGIQSPTTFMYHLAILDDLDIVNVTTDTEKEIVVTSLNNDSELVSLIKNIRDNIEATIAQKNSIIKAIEFLMHESEFDKNIEMIKQNDDVDEFIEMIRNYEDIDENEPFGKEVKEKLNQMKEDGTFEDFISYVKVILK